MLTRYEPFDLDVDLELGAFRLSRESESGHSESDRDGERVLHLPQCAGFAAEPGIPVARDCQDQEGQEATEKINRSRYRKPKKKCVTVASGSHQRRL